MGCASSKSGQDLRPASTCDNASGSRSHLSAEYALVAPRSPLVTPKVAQAALAESVFGSSERFSSITSPGKATSTSRRCTHSWCKSEISSENYFEHQQQCQQEKPMECFKCGQCFILRTIKSHAVGCHPVCCEGCGRVVLPRLLKYCPEGVYSAKRGEVVPVETPLALVERSTPDGTSELEHAAIRIQRTLRLARCRTILTENIFRLILREMTLARESHIVTQHHSMNDKSGRNGELTNSSRKRSALTTQCTKSDIPVDHYFPRELTSPLTMSVATCMMEDFTSGGRLPYAAAWRVCEEALGHLRSLPNVQHLDPPEGARSYDGRWTAGGKIVVVGDLHGQLHDLVHILHECGLPDPYKGTYYVFNGDFVDRGASSVEILLLLYTMMLACPQGVFLNRGNHEVYYMNEDYGFDVEVSTKYDRPIYHLIQRTFNAIPLCTCIARKVLVLHGGLPRLPGVTLAHIDAVHRFRPMPMPESDQCAEDTIFQDILWSDPWEQEGLGVSERGAGTLFGPDVTEAFLERNQLCLLLRSHEPFLRGYEEHHGGKVVTIFSASNYDGEDSNRASYAIVNASRADQPSYHSYRAHDMQELTLLHPGEGIHGNSPRHPHPGLSPHPAHSSAVEDVLRYIRERIYVKRHELLKYFNTMDVTKKGSVWKVEWVEAMRTVLSMEVPWFFLRIFLAEEDPETHRVNYTQFLWRYQNRLMLCWMNQLEGVVLHKLRVALRDKKERLLHQVADARVVTFTEFESLLHNLGIGLRDAEIFHLFTFFDRDFDGFLSVHRILDSLSETDPDTEPQEETLWELEVMQELQSIFISGRMSLEHVFRAMDRDGSGVLDLDAFVKGMTMLNRALSSPLDNIQMRELFNCVDVDQDGEISFQDFIDSFSVHDVVYDELLGTESEAGYRQFYS